MELGAVVVIPTGEQSATNASRGGPSLPVASRTARPLCSPRTPILGNDALQLWMDRIRKIGVGDLWLAPESEGSRSLGSRIADLTRQGVERLLLIKLKAYAEMDLVDLLRFHCEKRSPVTDAQDDRGPLGVRVLNRSALGAAANFGPSMCALDEHLTNRYQFRGYTKRLLSSQERQDLVRDALTGSCAMRPAGRQAGDQVWIADDVILDESVRMIGPAYIGPRTIVRFGATIGPFTSIERDCVVGHGTTVNRSSVLPSTELAPGLLIQQSIVDGSCLEHLEWQTVVDLAPAGLSRRISQTTFSGRAFRAKPTPNNTHTFAFNAVTSSKQPSPQSWVRVQL